MISDRPGPTLMSAATLHTSHGSISVEPANDGKQTPMRGHPVFTAQHATATCCRGCLAKWHGIEKRRQLTEAEIDYVVGVIRQWLAKQGGEYRAAASDNPPSLFDDRSNASG